jgi:hypothetical protein
MIGLTIVLICIAAGYFGSASVEASRVADCLLDGVCPACGKTRLEDGQKLGSWPRRWIPVIECADCRGRWRLPNRVRDERVRVARERAAKARGREERRGALVVMRGRKGAGDG